MKTRILIALALAMALVCMLCVAQAEGTRPSADDIMNQQYQKVAENQLTYAPKVTTLSNGVKVQRTPDGQGIYNTYYIKADQRGCYACHTDLNQTLQGMPVNLQLNNWMPSPHLDLDYIRDIKVTVDQCLKCHTELESAGSLNVMLHSLHSTTTFSAVGGSCQSCHVVMPVTGEWELWDDVKYQILSGIVSADATAGSFTFDQTTTIAREDLFVMDWLYEANDYERYNAIQTGDIEGDPALFDSWEIKVIDLEGETHTYLLTDLIANVPSKTALITMECVVNQSGGGLINNFEVTGLPIQDVLAYAGIGEDAKVVYVQNFVEDGIYPQATNLDWTKDHDVLLAYEIDGKRLRVQDGYPVMLCAGGLHAGNFKKQVWTLTVGAESVEMNIADTNPAATVINQAIFDTQEGQIIPLGEPYTFEGYAFGYAHEIASVDFSLDGGSTWATFETPDASDQQWIYWHYTFTPQEPGAYVLNVRATSVDGLTSEKPTTIMVNAK